MTFARRPHLLKRGLPWWRVRTNYPGVLLTFDDGPHPEYTPAVLDRLVEHGFPAIFFPVGYRLARAPHVPGQIAAAGHAIGNHTFLHERHGWLDFSAAAEDVRRCQEIMPAATYFRPPFGRLTPGLSRGPPVGPDVPQLVARQRRLALPVAAGRVAMRGRDPGPGGVRRRGPVPRRPRVDRADPRRGAAGAGSAAGERFF